MWRSYNSVSIICDSKNFTWLAFILHIYFVDWFVYWNQQKKKKFLQHKIIIIHTSHAKSRVNRLWTSEEKKRATTWKITKCHRTHTITIGTTGRTNAMSRTKIPNTWLENVKRLYVFRSLHFFCCFVILEMLFLFAISFR